jgi:4-hydroxy-3-polyprenylbenzoate decarboxylase
MQTELGLQVTRETLSAETLLGYSWAGLKVLHPRDYFSPPASGSFRHDGMVLIPCSMGALGRIAQGISDDLMTRAADVCLKERRPLILVVRETPFNLIHLRNMVQAAEAGAVILPANPSFYNRPKTLEEAVDTVVARTLQALGVEQNLVPEWGVEGD